jgi:hypothetical protein
MHLDAQLDGASLRHSYVWRTYPPSNTNGVFVDAPEPGPKYTGLNCPSGECDWSETSYAALKSLIENSIPTVGGRASALPQTATLEKPPYVEDEVVTKAWTDLAKVSAGSTGSYFNSLTKLFKEIGCAADGAPYVIGTLIRRRGNRAQLEYRFEGHPAEGAEVAGRLPRGGEMPRRARTVGGEQGKAARNTRSEPSCLARSRRHGAIISVSSAVFGTPN